MADNYNQVVLNGNIEGTLHFGIQGPPGPQGPDGGYYVPAVEQTGENELKFSFSPSSPNMPFVDPVRVSVTTEPGSGGNVDLTGYAKEQWVQQNYQPKGDYLGADELSGAIDTALAQAKASGAFDGEKGEQGEQGIQGEPGADGKNGEDGKTPVKGVDYWTEEDQAAMVNDVLSALPTWTGGSY